MKARKPGTRQPPEYIFAERARPMDAFYGPEAELFDEKPLLERRIQVTEDLVAFAGLCEPPRRGKRVNRDDNDDGKDTKEGPLWLMHICLNVRQMYKNMAE
jgi:hypothetical protein